MKSHLLLPLFLVMLLVATVSCSRDKTIAYAASPIPPPSHTQDIPLTRDAQQDSYVGSGPLTVENQVDVCALREGVVANISTDVGRYVRGGDLLAHLDDRQITAEVEAASARVRSIAANLKNWEAETKVFLADRQRAEKMWEANLITKQDLDHAVYKQEADVYEVQRESESLKNAEAAERALELEREKTQIKAPFDGVVARRYIRAGQKVAVGDRLFWVTATAPLRVRFTVPQRFLERIRSGQAVTVAPAELAGTDHPAKIVFVSPVVDPASGTVDVVAELLGSPRELRPGMQSNVRIPLRP